MLILIYEFKIFRRIRSFNQKSWFEKQMTNRLDNQPPGAWNFSLLLLLLLLFMLFKSTLYEEDSDKKDISMYSMLNPIIREKKNPKSTSWKWVERMERTKTIQTSGNPSDFIPIILLSIMRDYWACNRFFFSFSLLNLVDSSIR